MFKNLMKIKLILKKVIKIQDLKIDQKCQPSNMNNDYFLKNKIRNLNKLIHKIILIKTLLKENILICSIEIKLQIIEINSPKSIFYDFFF